MRTTVTLLAVLLAFATSVEADQFSFSYLFGDGHSVTGGFTGDTNLTGLGNFTTFIDGSAIYVTSTTAPVYGMGQQPGSPYDPTPRFAYDLASCRFILSNSDLNASSPLNDFWDFDVTDGQIGLIMSGLGAIQVNGQFQPQPRYIDWEAENPNAWTLIDLTTHPDPVSPDPLEVSANVPDDSSTVLLLGVALTGLAMCWNRLVASKRSGGTN